jgi:hypothetical protein
VAHLSPKFGPLKVLRCNLETRRYRLRFVFLLFLLGLVSDRAVAGTDVQHAPIISVGLSQQFAVADFDGDLRPDLASVQSEPDGFDATDYRIQFQFSLAGRQSIYLTAPAGGLEIEARDVNGDHAVDLVFSTAWQRQPVAILLNDGHGNFSRVEPTAFPEAFTRSTTKWTSTSDATVDAIGIPPQPSLGIWPQARGLSHVRSQAGFIPSPNGGFLRSSFLVSHAGRAPPSEVPHF